MAQSTPPPTGGYAQGGSVPTPASSPSDAPVLKKGVRVRLTDLQSRPDLNDTTGVLMSFDEAKGRWGVKLESSGETKSFKPANLVPLGTVKDLAGKGILPEDDTAARGPGAMKGCVQDEATAQIASSQLVSQLLKGIKADQEW